MIRGGKVSGASCCAHCFSARLLPALAVSLEYDIFILALSPLVGHFRERSAQEACDDDRACLSGSWVLAHVLLPDALAEEVLVEDVNVREEVLDILWLYIVRLFGSELLEETLCGLHLCPGVGL